MLKSSFLSPATTGENISVYKELNTGFSGSKLSMKRNKLSEGVCRLTKFDLSYIGAISDGSDTITSLLFFVLIKVFLFRVKPVCSKLEQLFPLSFENLVTDEANIPHCNNLRLCFSFRMFALLVL
jgi:hypothetical protein